MEKSKLILVLAMLLASLNIQAGWRVVIDKRTMAAVTANAVSQKIIEDKHNGRLDSIKSKQEKLMQYTATMASIKELYQLSMQNITGFGEESKYYGEIVSLTAGIFKDVPIVLKQLGKSPGKNYVVCINEMANLVSETEGLVHDFVLFQYPFFLIYYGASCKMGCFLDSYKPSHSIFYHAMVL